MVKPERLFTTLLRTLLRTLTSFVIGKRESLDLLFFKEVILSAHYNKLIISWQLYYWRLFIYSDIACTVSSTVHFMHGVRTDYYLSAVPRWFRWQKQVDNGNWVYILRHYRVCNIKSNTMFIKLCEWSVIHNDRLLRVVICRATLHCIILLNKQMDKMIKMWEIKAMIKLLKLSTATDFDCSKLKRFEEHFG